MRRRLGALFAILLAPALPAWGGATFVPTVISVAADSITVRTSSKPGLKVTDVDELGGNILEAPGNIQEYKVEAGTAILVNELPGTLADVQPGMIVKVNVGLDRVTVGSIDAHSIPPSPGASGGPRRKPRNKTASFGGAAHAEVVMAITPNRITVGVPGTWKAHAYYIGPLTSVIVAHHRGAIGDVRLGAKVDIHGSGTTAETIEMLGDE